MFDMCTCMAVSITTLFLVLDLLIPEYACYGNGLLEGSCAAQCGDT